jgi:translation initiation factor eIF-2B subunit gamma
MTVVTKAKYKNKDPEFVALVLASTIGTRLFPMTSEESPKSMLPVAGIPLLFRLLKKLQQDDDDDDDGGTPTTTQNIRWSVMSSAINETCVVVNDEAHLLKIVQDATTLYGYATTTTTTTTSDESMMTLTTTTTATTTTTSSSKQTKNKIIKEGTAVRLQSKMESKKKLTIVNIAGKEPCSGSVEAIRRVEQMNLIPSKSNIIVLPGDLVILEYDPNRVDGALTNPLVQLAMKHQKGGAGGGGTVACTVLLSDVGEVDEQSGLPLKESAKSKKGLLARDEEEIDYIGLSSSSKNNIERIIFKQSKLDVEEDKDMTGDSPKLRIPRFRIQQCSSLRVRTDWNDLHVYCLSPWVRNLLVSRNDLISLQTDLVPLLISRQWRGVASTFGSQADPKHVEEVLQTHWPKNTATNIVSSTMEVSSSTGDENPLEYTVNAHVITNKSVFRSHSIGGYLYANRELAHGFSQSESQKNSSIFLPLGATLHAKFQSVVLPGCKIADKVAFKSSVVGAKCTIGAKCRLNNVVLHDHVSLGDNTILQNTVVGSHCRIAENCTLNDCQVAAHKSIPAGTKKKGAAFIDDEVII